MSGRLLPRLDLVKYWQCQIFPGIFLRDGATLQLWDFAPKLWSWIIWSEFNLKYYWLFVSVKIIKNLYLTSKIKWIEIFEKLFYITIRHVYIFNLQEPRWCSLNCLELVIWQRRTLTLPKLCVMVPDHMIQDNHLGATFHRSTVSQPKISRELRIGNIGKGNERLSHRGRWDSLSYFLPS